MKNIFFIINIIGVIAINANAQKINFSDLNENNVIKYLSKDGYILRETKKTSQGYNFYSSYQENSSKLITSLIEQEIVFLNGYPVSFELNWKNRYNIQKDKSVIDDLDLNKVTNDLFRKTLISQFEEYKNKVKNILELSTDTEYKTKIENYNNINSFKAGEFKENDEFIYVKNTIDSKLDVTGFPFLIGVDGYNGEKIRIFDVSTYNIEEMIKLFIKDLKYHINDFEKNNIIIADSKKIMNLINYLDNIQINATFEEMDNQTLAVSFGINNDNNVIVKVNPINWSEASNQNKWYIIYHELGHDILNFQHGEGDKMMFNFIDRKYTWSEFFNDRKKMFDIYLMKKLIKSNDVKVVVNNSTNNIKKIIPTVKIGSQEWTTKNLDVSKYRNGDIIPEVKDPNEWGNLTTGAWCYYNNDSNNGKIYGKLYNWYAVNDSRGLAPEGSHIPSDAEWKILIAYLGGENVAGGKLKDIKLWSIPNKSATNSSGFRGLPGGFAYSSGGGFDSIYDRGIWWTSSEGSPIESYSWYSNLYKDNGIIIIKESFRNFGFSVRCIKD